MAAVITDIEYILRRAVVEIIVEQELRDLLRKGEKLRLKMGFDPSRPDLHLGYAVGLRKLRQFQELGHRVILIVGDWTARIGDPTGRSETRVALSEEQVNANAETYMRQFFRIVDRDRTEVVRQSQWFGGFGLDRVIDLTSRFTVAQMLAREDFAQRYGAGRPIAITEFLYPLLQGYDSVAIRSDVEFGGSDQKFNCLVGRDLQAMMGQRPQQILLTPLLLGTDGRKMSQSYGNYIAFETPPDDMYGKVMSVPDHVMLDYFELLTDVPDEELAEFRRQLSGGSVNPMSIKHRLANEIVTQFHGPQAAEAGQAAFRRVFQERGVPEEMPELAISFSQQAVPRTGSASPGNLTEATTSTTPVDLGISGGDEPRLLDVTRIVLQAGLVKSRGEAQRLIQQRGVEVDGQVIEEPLQQLSDGAIIRVGKRRFLRVRDSDRAGA